MNTRFYRSARTLACRVETHLDAWFCFGRGSAAFCASVFVIMGLPLCSQTVASQIAAHAQAAQRAERQNNFSEAVRQFQYVTNKLPRNAEMQSNLGVALYFDHQLTQAIAAFHKAIALNPDLLAPHLFSGLALYRLSNPNAAVPELQRAVRVKPGDVLARKWLGYAYAAQFRYEPALKQFQAASKLDPKNIDVWYALGQTFLQIGKHATRQLLTMAPDGGRAWELAGEQEKLQGHRKAALKDFEEALKRRPDLPALRKAVTELGGPLPVASRTEPRPAGSGRADALYRQAHEAEQKARAAFGRVGKIAPNSYRAHEIMGDSLTAQGLPEKAIQEYRTVLRLKPDLPGIHEAIGNALLGTGKTAEALREFRAELKIQPRSASVRASIGKALLLLGQDQEAGKMLASALKMNRPPPETYRLLGKLALRRKQYRSAVDALNRYLSAAKGDSRGYYLLAGAYRGLGDKEQMRHALALYEKTSRDAKAR
ncbi:MAG: tetratricopeptide repeat protein, partial [Bryobacteraceae bacterium]